MRRLNLGCSEAIATFCMTSSFACNPAELLGDLAQPLGPK